MGGNEGIYAQKIPFDPSKKWSGMTYRGFGGADMILFYKNQTTGESKVLGEMQSFDYDEDLRNNRVHGKLSVTVFEDTDFRPQGSLTLTLAYLNEYGGAFFREIQDVVFASVHSKSSVDDVCFTLTYHFESKKPVETVTYSTVTDNRRWKDILHYVREHKDSFSDPYRTAYAVFLAKALKEGKLTTEDII